MSVSKLPAQLKKYLAKPSTKAFMSSTKSYLTFCEELIKSPPNHNFLQLVKPRLEELINLASNLEDVPGTAPQTWSEICTLNDGVFNPLVLYLERSLSSDLMCFSYTKPYELRQVDHQFFVTELFSDLYLLFQDNIYRIETLATPSEIYTGLINLKQSFDEDWGPMAIILLKALNNPSNLEHRIALAFPPQPLQLN